MGKIKYTESKLEKLEIRAFELFEKYRDKIKVGKIMKLSELHILYLLLFSRGIQYKFFNEIYK